MKHRSRSATRSTGCLTAYRPGAPAAFLSGLPAVLLAVLLAFSVRCAAFLTPSFAAAGGNVTHTTRILSLQSSSVAAGDANVSVNAVIELKFTDKVDEITDVEYNKDCIHLTKDSGEVVPLNVIFPDTQLQQGYQKHIFVTPQNALSPSTGYTLTIDQNLRNKHGTPLDRSYQIRFTTAAAEADAVGASNDDLKALGDNILTYSSAEPTTNAGSNESSTTAAAVTDDAAAEQKTIHTVTAVLVPVLLVLVVVVFVLSLRRSRKKPKQ